jgi:hypothetical protein
MLPFLLPYIDTVVSTPLTETNFWFCHGGAFWLHTTMHLFADHFLENLCDFQHFRVLRDIFTKILYAFIGIVG